MLNVSVKSAILLALVTSLQLIVVEQVHKEQHFPYWVDTFFQVNIHLDKDNTRDVLIFQIIIEEGLKKLKKQVDNTLLQPVSNQATIASLSSSHINRELMEISRNFVQIYLHSSLGL